MEIRKLKKWGLLGPFKNNLLFIMKCDIIIIKKRKAELENGKRT